MHFYLRLYDDRAESGWKLPSQIHEDDIVRPKLLEDWTKKELLKSDKNCKGFVCNLRSRLVY